MAMAPEKTKGIKWPSEVSASEILHSLPDAVFTTDRQMRINYFNRAASEITGFSPREAMGMYCKDVLKSNLCEAVCPVKRALDLNENIHYVESIIRNDNNEQIDIIVNASLVKDASEKVIGYMYVFRNNTQLKKMMTDLENSRNELAAANRSLVQEIDEHKLVEKEKEKLQNRLHQVQKIEAIGTLAGGIAHDFNNLLMSIQGFTSLMLLQTGHDYVYHDNLKSIEAAVQRGAELTRQLLGAARGGKYEVKPTNLNELLQNSLAMFGRTKKEIRIHEKYQAEIWTVEVDRGQIDQVILNLLVNAWQSMPGGGDIYVETSNTTLDKNYTLPYGLKPGDYVRIAITDTGVGMDEDVLERIFDPFFTTKQKGRGTGLGLASAYGIIKNHDGIINAYSEKGRGSAFNIYLPASKKGIETEEKTQTGDIEKGTETVLIADDEDMVLQVGGEMLSIMGYKVLSAAGGNEAVELYQKHRDEIDLVILDMIMPDMGGGEVYEKIKKINPEVKVLLSSGYSINGDATEILNRGCNGFIQKPFDIKNLSQKIREILTQE